MLSRRGLITGLVGLVAAPAIVRVESLMKVKALPFDARENLYDVVNQMREELFNAYFVTSWDNYGQQMVERVEFDRLWTSDRFREINLIRVARGNA